MLPVGKAASPAQARDITIVSTMLMTDRALTAAETLAAEGIDAEVIELRWLRPLDYDSIVESVARTGRLLIVEEQVHVAGWGATVISRLTMDGVELRCASGGHQHARPPAHPVYPHARGCGHPECRADRCHGA